MNINQLIERTQLHDSSIVSIRNEENQVRLRFENIWISDDDCCVANIYLGGVRSITRDGEALTELTMETDDGGVIAFKRSGNTAELTVTWTSYEPRRDETHFYTFEFSAFEIQAERQNQP